MKTNRLILVVGLVAITLLAGCTKTSDSAPSPDINPPATDTAVDSAKQTSDMIDKIVSLFGASDEMVVETFGEGTANLLEENGQILSREYSEAFLEETSTIVINYDDNKNVANAYILLETNELNSYKVQLEAILGTVQSTDEDASQEVGSGSKSFVWNTEKAEIALIQAYDVISINIVPLP